MNDIGNDKRISNIVNDKIVSLLISQTGYLFNIDINQQFSFLLKKNSHWSRLLMVTELVSEIRSRFLKLLKSGSCSQLVHLQRPLGFNKNFN